MTEYEIRTVSVAITVKGGSLCDETTTMVSITDEAAGEFVEVIQDTDGGKARVLITPEEWPTLRVAIDGMIKECRSDG